MGWQLWGERKHAILLHAIESVLPEILPQLLQGSVFDLLEFLIHSVPVHLLPLRFKQMSLILVVLHLLLIIFNGAIYRIDVVIIEPPRGSIFLHLHITSVLLLLHGIEYSISQDPAILLLLFLIVSLDSLRLQFR